MKDMKTNWPFFIGGFGSLLIGFALGGFIFGMVVHENSHVIACLVFGLRIDSYSLTHVVYEESPNPLVNISVRLAGGIGQTLLSLLFFWYAMTLEKKALKHVVLSGIFDSKRSPILGIVFGFELAFLTVAFHGIANAIWEGFFFESYTQLHDNVVLWGIILLFGAVVSFYIVQRRYRNIVSRRYHE